MIAATVPATSKARPFAVPASVNTEIDALISHYPQKRSAAVMVLHALQAHFGYLSLDAIEWVAVRLELAPINVLELVTFYPMFHQEAVGKYHLKICRTLSCALAGSHQLYAHLCTKLGLDPGAHGPQTTPDGNFTVEFVECLASCGTAPVMMSNDQLHEAVTLDHVDALVARCT